MTVVAGIAAGDMRQSLAGSGKAIVAGTTGPDYLGVIDGHDGRKCVRRMTVFADVRRFHMSRVLADRFRTVMTAETVAANIDMVKVGRQPTKRAMAVVAGRTTGDMGWVLAGRNDPIVARATGPDNLAVIDRHDRHKDIRRMTIFADIRRLNVRQTLTGCIGTIVATDAVAADVDVIEVGGNPADRTVTVIAGIFAGDMRCVLATGDNAIMTRPAIAYDLCVIHRYDRDERSARMTILAHVGCQNVFRVLVGCIDTVMA